MNLLDMIPNPVLRQDMEEVSAYQVLEGLGAGSVILVTGATGLIGSQIVKALACHSQRTGKNLKVIALARSLEKARSVFGQMLEAGCIQVCVGDVTWPLEIAGPVDYIIHGASATSSKYFVEKPVETIFTALNGTRNILELAREKQVRKVVYLSSLEVYGIPDPSCVSITETDYGYIDPMQVRSSYSEGKRMAECVCISYAKEYGVPVTVARLSQTFGAGVSYDDGRVFAEFARCAIEGRDIVLHTQGNTVRTYCYTADALRAIFCLLLSGQAGEAYNVTNMDTAISIRDMGEMVCGLVPEKGIRVCIDIPENVAAFGYNPEMVIRLDTRKLQSLGWNSQVGLKEMFQRLIADMKQGRCAE